MTADTNGLEKELIERLIEKKLKISTAESCTGGLLSALLTSVPGASEVLDECIVTYSNEVKRRELGVKAETLDKFGAVSPETAYEMAEGICKKTGADIGVGITGIAGPGGGTAQKPVGLVYAGICVCKKTETMKFNFNGTRDEVREQTCISVLEALLKIMV